MWGYPVSEHRERLVDFLSVKRMRLQNDGFRAHTC